MDATPETGRPAEPQQPPIFEPQPERSASSRIFFGRFGMRAGWGIAIFLIFWLIVTVVGQLFGLAASGNLHKVLEARTQAHAHPHAPHPSLDLDFVPILTIAMDGFWFVGLFALCWFFSRAERRRISSYGIGSYRWKDVFPGAFWGLAIMSALVWVLRMDHVLVFDSRALSGSAAWLYGAKWLLAFLCVGLAEEYMFRGYFQFTWMRGLWGLAERIAPAHPRPVAFWLAAIVSSLWFFLLHTGNSGENRFGLFAVFLAGVLFTYALWRTGSLWWGIGFHMAWDWAQSFLFGVADSGNISVGRLYITHPAGNPLLSGGEAGPEGSVFVIGALVIALLVLRFTPSGTQPEIEQGSLGKAIPREVSAAL